MQKEIKQTWFFKQSPMEVWEYLTKPELMELWLMKTDFQPLAGHKFKFTFTAKPESKYEGLVNCEVMEIIPFTKLSYSRNGRMQDKSRTFESIVNWTLIPKGDGTELILEHNGLQMLDDILTHSEGWKVCLKRLEENISTIKQ
jgi:uncharacterized protein YndB with AHSA1/START domain